MPSCFSYWLPTNPKFGFLFGDRGISFAICVFVTGIPLYLKSWASEVASQPIGKSGYWLIRGTSSITDLGFDDILLKYWLDTYPTFPL